SRSEQVIELLGIGPMKADPARCAGNQTYHAAFQVALKIDDQVKASVANALEKRQKAPRRMPSIVEDRLIEPRMMFENRRRLWLDRPRDVRRGISAAKAPQQRQRAHHVANRTIEHDQNPTRFGSHRRQTAIGVVAILAHCRRDTCSLMISAV